MGTLLSLGLSIAVAALNVLIGAYVLAKNRKATANITFGAMGFATGAWAIGIVLMHYGPTEPTLSARLAFAAGSLLPITAVGFAASFPSGLRHISPSLLVAAASVALLFVAMSLSPFVVVSATRQDSVARLVYGPVHPFLAAYVMSGFALAIWLLGQKFRSLQGPMRQQAFFLLFALSIPMVLGVTTNLLVPIIFKTSAPGKFGPFFSLVMIALVAHAIIRHRLMDIRLVIRRGAVYLAAFLVAGLCLTGLLVVSNALVHDDHRVPLREIFLALLVAFFFPPLKASVQRAFDRYLYREPYDYQRTLRQASRALAETIELPVLLDRVAGVLRATLKPETVVVYLLDDEEDVLRRVYGPGPAPEAVPAAAALVVAAAGRPRPLFRDELSLRSRPGSAELEAAFAAWRAEVAVPLQDGARLMGLLVVGPKRSGDPFFSDDEDLLTTLANQSAVAIRNAQAHARVLRVNQELHKILATIESGVVAIGPHRRVTLSNRAAEVLTGVPAGTLRGRAVYELPVPLGGLVADTAQDGEPRLQVEFRLPDAAGQIVPLVCSTSPLRDPDGSLVGAVAVFNDLSRLKELEREKRRSERLGSLEAIASGMVHEIRNPLVAIKTFIQLLPRRAHEAEFRETMVRVAEREIARVEDLLGRLRTLASASRQPMVPLDVRDPLGAALELLGPEREARTIRLRRVADGAPRQILGNASQLEQLFHNLCLNALEAMGTEGELTVRVADLRQSGGTTLLVEISDTGPGVPHDLLPRLFDPFVTTKASGSGLGLAICRSIADAHRASLTVRNNIGRTGATFTLEFPVPVSQAVAVPV